MASRNFQRMQALEQEIKELHIVVAIGASGAPTLTRSKGVASIVRDSAGQYTVTLQDSYAALVGVRVVQQVATAQDINFQLSAEAVNVSKTFTFRCLVAATATDPSSGSKLFVNLALKNSAS